MCLFTRMSVSCALLITAHAPAQSPTNFKSTGNELRERRQPRVAPAVRIYTPPAMYNQPSWRHASVDKMRMKERSHGNRLGSVAYSTLTLWAPNAKRETGTGGRDGNRPIVSYLVALLANVRIQLFSGGWRIKKQKSKTRKELLFSFYGFYFFPFREFSSFFSLFVWGYALVSAPGTNPGVLSSSFLFFPLPRENLVIKGSKAKGSSSSSSFSSFCQPPISATFFRTSTLLAIARGTSGFCFAKSVGRTVV
jgi:hypothetical protein